jgi:hypothetical protein
MMILARTKTMIIISKAGWVAGLLAGWLAGCVGGWLAV